MKYRKKLVVIDAFQMTKKEYEKALIYMDTSFSYLSFNDWCPRWPDWLKNSTLKHRIEKSGRYFFLRANKLYIKTLEGDHEVSLNDWIIRGVAGELYPCKPDIFKQTYEVAKE